MVKNDDFIWNQKVSKQALIHELQDFKRFLLKITIFECELRILKSCQYSAMEYTVYWIPFFFGGSVDKFSLKTYSSTTSPFKKILYRILMND